MGSASRLTAIVDPVSGQTVTLTYNGDALCPDPPAGFDGPAPEAMLCQVTYPDNTATKVFYRNKLLARIEDPGGAVTDFGYDIGGRLIRIRDPLAADAVAAGVAADDANADTVITWAAGGAGVMSRPASIAAPVPFLGTARPAHHYDFNPAPPATNLTDVDVDGLVQPQGFARRVEWDDAGRITADTDATGETSSSTWDPNDNLTSATDPAGRRSTTAYNARSQPTDSWGPALSSCFNPNPTNTPNGSCAVMPHTSYLYDAAIPGLGGWWSAKSW